MNKKMYVTVQEPADDSLSPWNLDDNCIKENICMVHQRRMNDHYPEKMEEFLKFVDNMVYDFECWLENPLEDRVSFRSFLQNWIEKGITNEELNKWEEALKALSEDEWGAGDEEFFQVFLPLVCGGKWDSYVSTGYSQGDLRIWFYRIDKFDRKELDILSDYYWGGFNELHIQIDDSDKELVNDEDEIPPCSDDYWSAISSNEELDDRIHSLMDEHNIDKENVRVFEQEGYIQIPCFKIYKF